MGDVVVRDPSGRAYSIPEEQLPGYLSQGFTTEDPGGRAARLAKESQTEQYGGVGGALAAGALGALGTVTGGLSDAAFAATGNGDTLRALREENPISSTVGSIAGAFSPIGLPGLAAGAGAAIRGTEAATGIASALGRGALSGVAEGAIYGAGQGVSDVALSRDPLTFERAASVIGSNALYGGALGGGVGAAGGALEYGLGAAQRAIEARLGRSAVDTAGASALDAQPDLATLDAKGLKEARRAEVDAIDAGREPLRQQFADDLGAFRKDTLQDRAWLTTRGSEDRDVTALGRVSLGADKDIDRLLNNPLHLAEKPQLALKPLQQQQHALQEIAKLRDGEQAAFDNLPDTVREEILAGRVPGEAGPYQSDTGIDNAVHRELERRLGAPTATVNADTITPEQLEMLTSQHRTELASDRAMFESDAASERAAQRETARVARAKTDPAAVRAEIQAGRVPGEIGPYGARGLDAAVDRELARRGVDLGGMEGDDIQALIDRQRGAAGLGGMDRAPLQRSIREEAERSARAAERAELAEEARAAAADRAETKEMLERPLTKEQVQQRIDQSPDFRSYPRPARLRAHDKIAPQLERNLALQQRIGELMAEPTSDRLSAIDSALDAASAPREKSLGETIGGKLLHAIPGGRLVGELASLARKPVGRLRGAVDKAARRTGEVATTFLSKSQRVVQGATPLATKFLAGVSYGPTSSHRPLPAPAGRGAGAPSDLVTLFRQRTDEIKSQTAYDPTGTPRIRPEARQALAARLKSIRVTDPVLADRIETIAVRRLEYLSSLIPRRPDAGGITSTAWQPSDLEMRSWARSAAAVEHPGDVEDRVAHGTLTPEDATAYWAVYPERAKHFQQQILQQLPAARALPYPRRLTLGMFTGVPVDPAMHPAVLSVLQGQFAAEPGTSGGTAAPKAMPQMGSLKKSPDQPTPAQTRAQGAHA